MNGYAFILLALLFTVSISGEAQFNGYPLMQDQGFSGSNFYRTGSVDFSKPENRLFLNTLTVTLTTVTSTTTVVATTTCTTSTAAVSTCVSAGRRKRESGRDLYFNQEETDASPALGDEVQEKQLAVSEKDSNREVRSVAPLPAYPFIVQPGFNGPENLRGARFFLAFGTSTSITTTTTTYTYRLSVLCLSTSGYNAC